MFNLLISNATTKTDEEIISYASDYMGHEIISIERIDTLENPKFFYGEFKDWVLLEEYGLQELSDYIRGLINDL